MAAATLHSLRHVSSAIQHGEGLADEAEDLGVGYLAERLRERARSVADDLDAALKAIDAVKPRRIERNRAHQILDAVYADVTLHLEKIFSAEQCSKLSPGGHLDVSERVRFRLRNLPNDEQSRTNEALLDARALLERALFTYDTAVDGYLSACANAQSRKDCAVVRSQALRMELERAKHALLVQAEPKSDIWQRIKRRTVRTKRARWLDEAKAQRLLTAALL